MVVREKWHKCKIQVRFVTKKLTLIIDCFYYARFSLSFDDRVSTYDVLTVAKGVVCSAENLSFIDSVRLFQPQILHLSMKLHFRTVKLDEVAI